MFAPSSGTVSENGESPAVMEKGPFSVEWLAQSSRGGDNHAARGESSGTAAGGRRKNNRGACGAARVTTSPTPLPLPAAHSVQTDPQRGSPAHEVEAGGGSRPRTKFSAAQLQELERSFREQRYIGASEKKRLAAALDLSQSQIKTWFQNRRMKFKRETQDARVEALVSGLFLPYRCYPDTVTPSCRHGVDVSVSSTPGAPLHPAGPSPALLVPPVPAQLPQTALPGTALLFPPSPALPVYSAVIPAVTLTNDHKGLRFQPYLPSC
ncbi:homeobox protein vex1-like [Coturnix japonica]|uniref:Homeobox protein vex1-like n=1 Tax=Coturnix japonica TaxID=93934 RepID=A0A8C2YGG1_COTJA|nr:homeobox protein vex1-like [Coturnix japonica]